MSDREALEGRTSITPLRALRKIAVVVFGTSVLAIGVLMLVLPGPAFVVIPAGLSILALEFVWARRWLVRVQRHANDALRSLRTRGNWKS
ncbi:MAG: PGPGW domain-containing protein [Myxococcota bacterium]|jgi:tellurite resistance protein TerC|nr:PGPGW domain-containing protein [Myxococcota bacterium]